MIVLSLAGSALRIGILRLAALAICSYMLAHGQTGNDGEIQMILREGTNVETIQTKEVSKPAGTVADDLRLVSEGPHGGKAELVITRDGNTWTIQQTARRAANNCFDRGTSVSELYFRLDFKGMRKIKASVKYSSVVSKPCDGGEAEIIPFFFLPNLVRYPPQGFYQTMDRNDNQTLSAGPVSASNVYFGQLQLDGVGSNFNMQSTVVIEVSPTIHSIELTQAVQQWQDLSGLRKSIETNGSPPVPIIANKPAVLRIYVNKVKSVKSLRVEISGVVADDRPFVLEPHCTPKLQRAMEGGCRSFDTYFTPPKGDWDVDIRLFDSADLVQTERFHFSSREARPLLLRAVSICDAMDEHGNWLCAPASALSEHISLLRKVYPSHDVSVEITNIKVRRDSKIYAAAYPTSAGFREWWIDIGWDLSRLYLFRYAFFSIPDVHIVYFGMVRPEVPAGRTSETRGIGLPFLHAAASRTVVLAQLGIDVIDVTDEAVAHEIGHELDLEHTNLDGPSFACYGKAISSKSDWPFPDNFIQSVGPAPDNGARPLEVGFDLEKVQPLQPEMTFDVMSYCVPRWIAPVHYVKAMEILGAAGSGAPPSPLIESAKRPRAAANSYWTISGTITNQSASFSPIFEVPSSGLPDQPSGLHRMVITNTSGAVLFTHQFTPSRLPIESAAEPGAPASLFAELVPVQPGGVSLVVFDPDNIQIGTLTLGGATPDVLFASAFAGSTVSGTQAVSWVIDDRDSSRFTTKILYSADAGEHWIQLDEVAGGSGAASVKLDFDELPGSEENGALMMVWVSDGVNSTQTISAPFTVPRKSTVTTRIAFPPPNHIFRKGAPVSLRAIATDLDDGVLKGKAVEWNSSIDGPLGNGSALTLTKLSPGHHQITVTATDSDGNADVRAVPIFMADRGPSLNLAVSPLSSTSTTCMQIAIQVEPGSVGLAKVEFRVNGEEWKQLPLTDTPHRFTLPGSGNFNVIAHAYDVAGQVAAKEIDFFTTGTCLQ